MFYYLNFFFLREMSLRAFWATLIWIIYPRCGVLFHCQLEFPLLVSCVQTHVFYNSALSLPQFTISFWWSIDSKSFPRKNALEKNVLRHFLSENVFILSICITDLMSGCSIPDCKSFCIRFNQFLFLVPLLRSQSHPIAYPLCVIYVSPPWKLFF